MSTTSEQFRRRRGRCQGSQPHRRRGSPQRRRDREGVDRDRALLRRRGEQFGRDLLGTWSMQSEAALKTAFDAQNAAVDAGLGLFDLGVKGNRQAVEQFAELVKRTQQATLESWQTAVKAAAKATEPAKR